MACAWIHGELMELGLDLSERQYRAGYEEHQETLGRMQRWKAFRDSKFGETVGN